MGEIHTNVIKRGTYAINTSKINNKTDYDSKIKDIENKIPSEILTLSFVRDKIPNVSD